MSIIDCMDVTQTLIWKLLDSNVFIGLVTIFVGSWAYILYRAKKAADKRDAANILLVEIQNAQRRLREAIKHLEQADNDETIMIAEDITLMPNESWTRYKYLFVNDFERDDWDTLSTFYERAKLYDAAVAYNNSGFQKNEQQIRIQQAKAAIGFVANFVDTNPDDARNSSNEKAAIAKARKAGDILLDNLSLMSYKPRKPVLEARAQLRIIGTYEMSPITLKFQQITQRGIRWRWSKRYKRLG